MAQAVNRKLDIGDKFPDMDLSLISGKIITIPGMLKGKWGVFLVYRGHW